MFSYSSALLLSPFLLLVTARDITFPPAAGHVQQSPLSNLDDIDIITGSQFSGLNTFAHLPYVNCFGGAAEDEVEKYDIAIVGAPFDTVGMQLCCVVCTVVCCLASWLRNLLTASLNLFYLKRLSSSSGKVSYVEALPDYYVGTLLSTSHPALQCLRPGQPCTCIFHTCIG